MLTVPVPVGTDSYPNSCPTDFLPTGTRIMDIHCHLYLRLANFNDLSLVVGVTRIDQKVIII
jgi:hypothetical protein